MRRAFLKYVGAGLGLALLELCLTLTRGYGLFLTARERLEYAFAALSALPASVLLLGLALERATSGAGVFAREEAAGARVWRGVLLASGGTLAALAGHFLTAGRRVRDLPSRYLWVVAFALAATAVLWLALRCAVRVAQDTSWRKRGWLALLLLLAASCFVLDSEVLVRSYPAFHLGLFALALLTTSLSVAPLTVPPFAHERWLSRAALLLALLSPLALFHLARQPNASYATSERAPLTAKLLKPWLRAHAAVLDSEPVRDQAALPASVAVSAGVDLRDRDVLLITVDALRADLLRAHGGKGVTPEIDKLASESLVFRHAYTVAPHTSYALASLLTAKFIKPISELSSLPQDHKTLPDLLKRYGYRTAAFYPPAVFYVDGARFHALAERSFGFEYKKEMFAPAHERVQQVGSYLAAAEPKYPLFIWLHLFEPHEPYDPPAGLATSDTARGRYEGEVRAADRAIGELVRLFRAARPLGTVILSADHGEEFGDHGGNYHGTTLFEEQVHVPLLWSSPGAVKPGVSDVPVELVDVGTTILSSAGVQRDARMRGDDLGGVLSGAGEGPKHAFASVEERHMVSDGRFKAICSASSLHCELFDLEHDPGEQRNLAGAAPERVAALRRELFAFLSSVAKREAMAVEQGVSFPEALARARLGAPGAGAEVVPLLKDERASVRAASARILGELGTTEASASLAVMASADVDADVRAEAAIAALALGSELTREPVALLLAGREDSPEGLSRKRRAALSLASRKDLRAVPWLSAWLRDPSAQESERLRAIAALSTLGHESGVAALVAALDEVRLREASAAALAVIGGQRARDALFAALQGERYEPARAAEAAALVKLRDKRVRAQIERFLGMETSIPQGVRLLLELSAVPPPSARRGAFSCTERGCVPGKGARIVLPPLHGARQQRVTLLVFCEHAGASLRVGSASYPCAGGEQQLSFLRVGSERELPLQSTGGVEVIAWMAVPAMAEIPPPAPEPWDAGVADAALEAGP